MAEAKITAPVPLPPAVSPAGSAVIPLPLRAGSIPPAAEPSATAESRTLWYALYFPQLATFSPARQRGQLQQLAALADSVSSTVSYHDCALVLEIRSSLKYFGGMEALHRRLQAQLAEQLRQWQLPEQFHYAASPTVTGSLLLARGGSNRLVYRRANLRSALGTLPASVLHLDKEASRRLHNMGVRYLRDLWRLPADGLRKRFGSDFLRQLQQALGRLPEPTHNYQPPPAFTTSYDLPYEVENLDRLLPVADELLAQLCDFLQRRDLSTSRLQFVLRHEQQEHSVITLGLRQASRNRQHLMLLLETRLARLTIPAPVIGLGLTVKKFDAFLGHNEQLFRMPGATAQAPGQNQRGQSTLIDAKFETEQPVGRSKYSDPFDFSARVKPDTCPRFMEFMEHLQARLGDHCLKSIHPVAEHCPEYAVEQRDFAAGNKDEAAVPGTALTAVNPRPLWLLAEAQELSLRQGKLCHERPLRILSGPERIETRWWSGTDIRRDYYVAEDNRGGRLWIYHEKNGLHRWFLHGLFA